MINKIKTFFGDKGMQILKKLILFYLFALYLFLIISILVIVYTTIYLHEIPFPSPWKEKIVCV